MSLIIKLPIQYKLLANSISRSLEPDSGGSSVFDSISDDTYAIADIPMSERFSINFLRLINDYEELVKFINIDYLSRWPEVTPPSASEIKEFCNNVSYTIE